MRDEFIGQRVFVGTPAGTRRGRPDVGDQRLMACEEFVDLTDVVSQRLGGGINGGQAAADHDRRQAQLHVGDRVGLRRAGELQGHQEVACGAHAARQAVRNIEGGRFACADGQRDMVKAELPGVVNAQCATEAHAADQRELIAPLEQQAHDLQEILVPAHRDAVFGHAAEAGNRAGIEVFVQGVDVAHRRKRDARAVRVNARQRLRQRLDFQAVDRHDGVSVVHQMVSQRESRRACADHEHLAAAGRCRQGAPQIQRIPARQQRVDLETPGQLEHILERAGLGLGNVDRRLRLIDAGLHAVVADAMPGGGDHRIVDHHHRQRRDRQARALERMKLRDPLLERTSGQGIAEGIAPPGRRALAGRGLAQSCRAGVGALLVAQQAIVGLVKRTGQAGAGIGERKRRAIVIEPAPDLIGPDRGDAHAIVFIADGVLEQIERIDVRGMPKQHAVSVALATLIGGDRPGAVEARELQPVGMGRCIGLPAKHCLRKREFIEIFDQNRGAPVTIAGRPIADSRSAGDRRGKHRARSISIKTDQRLRRHAEQRLAFDEFPFDPVERIESGVRGSEQLECLGNAEEPCDEGVDMGADLDQQRRFSARVDRIGYLARVGVAPAQAGVGCPQTIDPSVVEALEPLALMQVLEAQAEIEDQAVQAAVRCHFSRYFSLSFTSFQVSASAAWGLARVMLGQFRDSSILSLMKCI